MKRFAVGHFSLFTNELKIEIIEANSWYGALMSHSAFSDDECTLSSESLELAKQDAFDQDQMIDVVTIN